jgi:putative membrane protein
MEVSQDKLLNGDGEKCFGEKAGKVDVLQMNLISSGLSLLLMLGLVAAALPLHAGEGFSAVDKAFVGKVSQGGMYEVALGQVAETMGQSQDIKDSANTEVHDHQLVGDKLKSIMEANGMEFPTALNAEFQARLDKMKGMPAGKFDAAYLADMKKIHEADGAAFAREARQGTNLDLKAFAAETYKIVQRHLGELGANTE